ncbi:MAG: hypothetical protein JSV91_15215 [Phycisphaerales bacterium]|nr:MAG: hypothetical protein JSV91_15215 [Phycisphaerales bacterium]
MNYLKASAPSLITVALICLPLSGTNAAYADIIYVPGDYPSIQVAIDVADPGDEVVVAPDQYYENINLSGKAITVRSTDPTDPAVVVSTIIHSSGRGSVVICHSGEGPDTVLSGFVITGGSAGKGGGMFIFESSPTVSYCTFADNSTSSYGGGMQTESSDATILNCTFADNESGFRGGGLSIFGGSPTLTDCAFLGNSASGWGGGICSAGGHATITRCEFIGNSAGDQAGALHTSSADLILTDCTFKNNSAATGGAMYYLYGSPIVTGCAFVANTADVQGGGIYSQYGAGPALSKTVLCGNAPDQIFGAYLDEGENLIAPYAPPGAPAYADSCPADVNDDGFVDIDDIFNVLAQWGPCE